MSTTPLAEVSDADFVDQPDWSSSLYIYEDKTSWAKSLEKCYVKLPNAFKHYPFVLDPDTHDQMSIKTNAAENAINFIMDSYDRNLMMQKTMLSIAKCHIHVQTSFSVALGHITL